MIETGPHIDDLLERIGATAAEREKQARFHASESSRLQREADELRLLLAGVERLARDTRRGTA